MIRLAGIEYRVTVHGHAVDYAAYEDIAADMAAVLKVTYIDVASWLRKASSDLWDTAHKAGIFYHKREGFPGGTFEWALRKGTVDLTITTAERGAVMSLYRNLRVSPR